MLFPTMLKFDTIVILNNHTECDTCTYDSCIYLKLQEIPFRHVWSGTQSGLHCSFPLERSEIMTHVVLNCDIHIFQQMAPGYQQVLQVKWTPGEVSWSYCK